MKSCILAVACLVFALVTVRPALSAKIVVHKGGAFSTIQAGVDAAGPGDTVIVKAGVYDETIVISGARDGVMLKASGNVIIDARLPNGDPDGPGIRVDADDVTLRGFTIRHAAIAGPGGTAGAGVYASGSNTHIEKVQCLHCEAGIVVGGSGTIVRGCTIIDTIIGVYLTFSNDSLIENCSIEMCGERGIVVSGSNTVVRKNRIKNVAQVGIQVAGSHAIVDKNTVHGSLSTGVSAFGIAIASVNALVRGNKVSNISGAGIDVQGGGALIANNAISNTELGSIQVSGNIGSSFTLRKNRARGSHGGGSILIYNSVEHVSLESNVIDQTESGGFYVLAKSVTARKNIARRVGFGFDFSNATMGVIEKNVFKGGVLGFTIDIDNGEISSNLATGGTSDGFRIHGTNCVVSNNVALKNAAEGFELHGAGLVFQSNTARQNRIDVTATVMPTTFHANKFDSGGPTTPPEIE